MIIDIIQNSTATPKAIMIYFTILPPVSSFIIAQCFTKSMGSGLYPLRFRSEGML